ncbi:hypothetical protein [Dyadobacter sp. CY312]|uniref:hypothetical protein n=1 Tax=Dyadobacter sp. CY312 TaxID=2907303 RepID=UPI001F33ED1A|nr:hypothetical protein [Dyadobacter sp. CY312]
MQEIEFGQDIIWLNKNREELDISLNTYKEAVTELIKKCFLNKTTVRDVYWANPYLFFAGDRIRKFPSCVVKR